MGTQQEGVNAPDNFGDGERSDVADGVGLGLSVGSSPRISVTKIQGGTKENEPCKIAAQSLL